MPKRILIVEDEAIVAFTNATMAELLGYEVVGPAQSCSEALAAAKVSPPDLALVDIRIKGDVDGIGTALRLRDLCDCKIVFVTGQGDSQTRQRAEAIHPSGYLQKPFSPEQFESAISQAFLSGP